MASVPSVLASRDSFTQTSSPPRRGLFRRLLDAMIASQQRRADREIARFIQAHGGRLNDDAEREIERDFLLPPHGLQPRGRSR